MPVDRESGRPRGFAFVEFTERSVAEEAINKFNGQPFQGRNIAVSEARARESRPGGGRPPSRSSGASSRPSGPRMGSRPSMPSRGPGERSENFGPPATPKRLRSKKGQQQENRPRGPIKERSGGRFSVWEGVDDDSEEPLTNFDDVTTRVLEVTEEGDDVATRVLEVTEEGDDVATRVLEVTEEASEESKE
jgi:RNA recognition motif-containing protein